MATKTKNRIAGNGKPAAPKPPEKVNWELTGEQAALVAQALEAVMTAPQPQPGQAANNARAVLPVYDSLMQAFEKARHA